MDVAAERRDVSEQGAQRVHHPLGKPAAKQRRHERRRARALRQSRAESLGEHAQAHKGLVGAAATAAAEGRAASRRRLECVTALGKKRLQKSGDRAAKDELELTLQHTLDAAFAGFTARHPEVKPILIFW